ncbi:MAG: TIGR03749 family integrating conjugative element protein [Gammaproteobacteria bacterium]|nr:TIGR03749 family integrating conjugative element protein [Gammaproteobacteria bacterium]
MKNNKFDIKIILNCYSALFLLLLLLCSVALADSTSPRHHVWNKMPIKVVLPVGTEKRIEFPAPVSDLKIPAQIGEPASRVQLTPDGRLYWLATIPWESVRVIAQTADGYVYLLDVQASEEAGEANPLIIEHASNPSLHTPLELSPPEGYDYVDLVRFAAQHMHGPQRLIKPLPGLTRTAIKKKRIDHLIRGDQLSVTQLAQWRSARPELYVTAVAVTNKMRYPVPLSPLTLRSNEIGAWSFAASHHPAVNPIGQTGDTSVWYLVSKKPFQQIIGALDKGAESALSESPEDPDHE